MEYVYVLCIYGIMSEVSSLFNVLHVNCLRHLSDEESLSALLGIYTLQKPFHWGTRELAIYKLLNSAARGSLLLYNLP